MFETNLSKLSLISLPGNNERDKKRFRHQIKRTLKSWKGVEVSLLLREKQSSITKKASQVLTVFMEVSKDKSYKKTRTLAKKLIRELPLKFHDLPTEIITYIFSFLGKEELLSLNLVSKEVREILIKHSFVDSFIKENFKIAGNTISVAAKIKKVVTPRGKKSGSLPAWLAERDIILDLFKTMTKLTDYENINLMGSLVLARTYDEKEPYTKSLTSIENKNLSKLFRKPSRPQSESNYTESSELVLQIFTHPECPALYRLTLLSVCAFFKPLESLFLELEAELKKINVKKDIKDLIFQKDLFFLDSNHTFKENEPVYVVTRDLKNVFNRCLRGGLVISRTSEGWKVLLDGSLKVEFFKTCCIGKKKTEIIESLEK